jgi:Ca2+-binding EF-hand superfamily protein
MKFPSLAILALIGAAVPVIAQDIPDRPVRRAEVVAAAKRQFAMIDANHDGVVTRAEFERFRLTPAGRAAIASNDPFIHLSGRWFEHADPNGTGRATAAMAAERPLGLFDQADLNRDGVLSVQELKLAQAVRALSGH